MEINSKLNYNTHSTHSLCVLLFSPASSGWLHLIQVAHRPQSSIHHRLLRPSPTKNQTTHQNNLQEEEAKGDRQKLCTLLNARPVRRSLPALQLYRATSYRYMVKTNSSNTPVVSAQRHSPAGHSFPSICAPTLLSVRSSAHTAIRLTRLQRSYATTAVHTQGRNHLFVLTVARHLCRPFACVST